MPDEAGNEDSGIDVTITDRDGGMVTRYVAVAEVIEPDGTESLRIRMSPGLAEWDALGMLHFTTAHTADRLFGTYPADHSKVPTSPTVKALHDLEARG